MKGFTLIEILLIVAALAILSGITIIAINPSKQFADVRNAQRRVDVGILYSAVHQYALDHHGDVPANIPSGTLADCQASATSATFTVCKTGNCSLTLPELTTSALYLSELPSDGSASTADYTGYNLIKNTDYHDRITVCAPAAENGDSIYLPH
jgi:type II secretory pathway pseudopilin PulG